MPDSVDGCTIRLGHDARESHAVLLVRNANERTVAAAPAPVILEMGIPILDLVAHSDLEWACGVTNPDRFRFLCNCQPCISPLFNKLLGVIVGLLVGSEKPDWNILGFTVF